MHALVWVGGWSKAECEEAVKNTAETGYGLIEIPALDPKSIDVQHTLSVLKNYNIKSACSLGLSFDADINNEDSDVVARGEKKLNDALDVVSALGGNYLGGVIYSALGKYKLPPSKKAFDNAVGALTRLAKRAKTNGITLGLEPVNRYESNLINTADQALEIIQKIGENNVVVHLDVYHMNIEEQDLAGPIKKCGTQLGNDMRMLVSEMAGRASIELKSVVS